MNSAFYLALMGTASFGIAVVVAISQLSRRRRAEREFHRRIVSFLLNLDADIRKLEAQQKDLQHRRSEVAKRTVKKDSESDRASLEDVVKQFARIELDLQRVKERLSFQRQIRRIWARTTGGLERLSAEQSILLVDALETLTRDMRGDERAQVLEGLRQPSLAGRNRYAIQKIEDARRASHSFELDVRDRLKALGAELIDFEGPYMADFKLRLDGKTFIVEAKEWKRTPTRTEISAEMGRLQTAVRAENADVGVLVVSDNIPLLALQYFSQLHGIKVVDREHLGTIRR